MKVLGKENVDYLSRKSNQQVTGVTLHCASDGGGRVEGQRVDTVFVSARSACYGSVKDIKVGSEINVYYNRFGSVEGVSLAGK